MIPTFAAWRRAALLDNVSIPEPSERPVLRDSSVHAVVAWSVVIGLALAARWPEVALLVVVRLAAWSAEPTGATTV
jgi:hypothetical protein